MEGREKPHTDIYKEVAIDWNYDATCMLTSFPVWNLENFLHLVSVVQSVPSLNLGQGNGYTDILTEDQRGSM
jgi:hypothetical protein